MLELSKFKSVVENTPLVSIDLCLIFEGKILLGKRNNEPLKGEWFTPGGRIYKNERWQNALRRIGELELGLSDVPVDKFELMGVWDHFYSNSIIDQDISTHYVNLPHYIVFKSRPLITIDDQHGDFQWFGLSVIANDEKFYPYIRNYADWIVNRIKNTHD